jgi:hypothetical protein
VETQPPAVPTRWRRARRRGAGPARPPGRRTRLNTRATTRRCRGITLTHSTVIAPWSGKGIGVYGGSNQDVEFNDLADNARYIGLGAGRSGVKRQRLLGATVNGNVVVRSGGNGYSQGQPALQIGNGGDGQTVGVVDRVTAINNTVTKALGDGVGFSTSTNTLLQNNTITAPWRTGFVVAPPFYPAPSLSASVTGNTVTGLSSGMQPFVNNSSGFTASVTNEPAGRAVAPRRDPSGVRRRRFRVWFRRRFMTPVVRVSGTAPVRARR